METLNVAHTVVMSEVNGPGRRFALWVQGCPLNCEGCFNPGLRPFAPRRGETARSLAREALAADVEAPLAGITLSGGEPFAQAEGLARFLAEADKVLGRRLPVIAFTGFTLEELRAKPEAKALLERIDLLIDGPYRAGEPSDSHLLGSSNQRLSALTPAGEALKLMVEAAPATFGVVITGEGEVLITGFPPAEAVERIRGAFNDGN